MDVLNADIGGFFLPILAIVSFDKIFILIVIIQSTLSVLVVVWTCHASPLFLSYENCNLEFFYTGF